MCHTNLAYTKIVINRKVETKLSISVFLHYRRTTSPTNDEYVNAMACLQILNLHRKQKLVTLLQSHACDTQATKAKDYLNCTIGLQALHALERRRCIFLSCKLLGICKYFELFWKGKQQ